jgi:hypothetical protein
MKVLLQKAIFIVYCGDAIIQVQHFPSDQTTAPSETQINPHEERLNKGFLLNQARYWPFKKTYEKFSSNGLDLVELEPKPVDHLQIPIGPVRIRLCGCKTPSPTGGILSKQHQRRGYQLLAPH